jgi:hypothetical protein
MATLDLHRWLQVAARRAISSTDHLTEALTAKGYVIACDASEPAPEPDSGRANA